MIHQLEVEPQPLERVGGQLVPQVGRLLLRGEDKVLPQQPAALADAVLGRRGGVDPVQVDDQALLDAEDGVGGLVGVASEIEGSVFTRPSVSKVTHGSHQGFKKGGHT